MKRFLISIGCALALVLATDVASAQGKGGGPKPKVTSGGAKAGGATHPGGTKSHAPSLKTTNAGGGAKTMAKVSGPKSKTTTKVNGPKSKTATTTAKANGPKSKATTTKTAKATEAKSKSVKTAKATDTSSTTAAKKGKTSTTTTSDPVTLTKVQQKLQQNTKLASKLESRLPKGTDLMSAAEGFRNLGQLVAAVNASNNLGLDFDRLKTAMVDDGMSLGQAIKDQRTSIDSTAEATRAQRDADTLIRSTETTSTSTTSTTAKTRKAKDSRP